MKTGLTALLRNKCVSLIAFMFFLCAGSIAYGDQKQTLLGYVVFPDLARTLDMAEKIAAKIDPAQFQPGMLKGQMGALLNDPTLANIDKTKPLVIALYFKPSADSNTPKGKDNIAFAAFIPAKDKTRYKKIFDGMNMPSAVNGDVLVLGNTKASLDGAMKELDLYKNIASQKLKNDIRLMLKIDSIMSVFDSEISMMTTQLQAMEDMQGETTEQQKQLAPYAAVGKLFVYCLLDMAAQSKDYQLDITLNEKMVLFSSEHSSKPGSPLSAFFDGTAPGKNRCIGLIPAKGDFTYAGYIDMKRLGVLMDSLITNAMKRNPSLKSGIDITLIDEYRKFMNYYTGEFAIVYGFEKTGRLQMEIAASTDRSAEEHLAINEKFIAAYSDAMKKLGQDALATTEYKLLKNVRKSGGYDVHKYVFKMDYSKMSEEEKASIEKMLGKDFSAEYAVANGYLVASTRPKVLDKMIENTGTGGTALELQAMKTFGPGMDSYIDFDVIGFIEKIMAMTAVKGNENNPEMQKTLQMFKKFTPEERTITSSSKYSKGTSYNKYQVSIKMITDSVKFFNEQKKAALSNETPAYIPGGEGN